MDERLLSGKNIVVTGASSGIGRAICVQISREGARVLGFGRDPARLKETQEMLEAGDHMFVSADLTQYETLSDPVNRFVEMNGPIDGFVHAAGIELTAPFQLTKPAQFDQLFKINVIAGFELARILSQAKNISPEAGASFVFIASIRALYGQSGGVAYAASKGAVRSGVKSLAIELSRKKIRVNAIFPSIVLTSMTEQWFESIPEATKADFIGQHPLGLGKPEDVANCCLFLLSGLSRWMTGSDLVIDGGFSAK